VGSDHVFKIGLDIQQSSFEGESSSQQLDVRRLDGSLAERSTYAPPLAQSEVTATEFAVFVQDRWRVSDRLAFELGFRTDRDGVVERANFSPRAGMSVCLLPEGGGVLRAGFGPFAERSPLSGGAFTQMKCERPSDSRLTGGRLLRPSPTPTLSMAPAKR
jgi:outer membrane receptor protein involved in Fe transport